MKQFVVIARDADDAEALKRRLNVRADHIAGASKLKATGNFVVGGAMLDENGNMCGSVMIMQFESDEEFQKWYKNEPYIVNEVWQTIEVKPFKVANVE